MGNNLLMQNPFAVLTFIAAPAVLTNATSVLALSTINRMLRTRERMHELLTESQQMRGENLLAQVNRVERQGILLLRAMAWVYLALGAFAAATLVTLLGAVAGQLGNAGFMHVVMESDWRSDSWASRASSAAPFTYSAQRNFRSKASARKPIGFARREQSGRIPDCPMLERRQARCGRTFDGVASGMKAKSLLAASMILSVFCAGMSARADRLDMQNGDRYFGKVLTINAETIVLESDVLGKISVPRAKVSGIALGAYAAAPLASVAGVSVPTNFPRRAASPAVTNADLSAAFRSLGANTNFVQQIREQLLSAAGPEANQKYDDVVGGLMSGRLNLNDIRAQAKTAADQLRAAKKDLGPDADDALDMYLAVLENFLNETGGANSTPAQQPKTRP